MNPKQKIDVGKTNKKKLKSLKKKEKKKKKLTNGQEKIQLTKQTIPSKIQIGTQT